MVFTYIQQTQLSTPTISFNYFSSQYGAAFPLHRAKIWRVLHHLASFVSFGYKIRHMILPNGKKITECLQFGDGIISLSSHYAMEGLVFSYDERK